MGAEKPYTARTITLTITVLNSAKCIISERILACEFVIVRFSSDC